MHVITQSSILFLWMQTLTFVKSQEDCTLEQFLKSKDYDEHFDTSDMSESYSPGKQVRVSCNVGYTGFFKLMCVEGTWQPRGSKCQPKSCGHPGDSQFADFALVDGDDFVFGSQVVYTCHKGYQMVSRINFRRCMAGGWDGVVPICEAQQCPAIHVDTNVLVTGDPDEATYGNVVRFSCKSNNQILDGPTEIECDENGDWSGEPPKCKEVKCEAPVIENGYVPRKKQEYIENDILHFACNPGFQRTEERPSKCTKFGSRAEWSPTPSCELVKCRLSQADLEGTTYDPAYRNVFSPGDTLRVNCGPKYWISDPEYTSAVTTCKQDGQWTIRPVCQEVRCSNQRQPHVYGWYPSWRSVLDTTVRYSCDSGYRSPDGRGEATCTRKGWSPDPLCEEITCDRKDYPGADIDGTVKDKYSYRESVSYTCREGFTGDFTITCWDRGWSGSQGCREITCDRKDYPGADIDGTIKDKYSYKEIVTYTCREGFTGDFTITCGERGWTRSEGCREIKCNIHSYRHADPENRYKRQYNYNEVVRYICRESGEFTLRCGATGWIGSSICEERTECNRINYPNADIVGPSKAKYKDEDEVKYDCKDGGQFTLTCGKTGWIGTNECTACTRPSLSKGFVVGPINQTVYFACDEGYKLFTKGWWGAAKCNGSEWSIPKCIEKNDCGAAPVIANGEVDLTGQIKCNEGYQPKVDSLICHRGKWNSEGQLRDICTPIAVHCSPPPKVANAIIVSAPKKEYLSDSEVTYQCRNNYELQGENTIQCKNGTWEKKNTECTVPTEESYTGPVLRPRPPKVQNP